MTLSPIDRVRLRKAAVDEGFGIDRGEGSDWLAFDSIDAPASLRLTRDPSGYIAATNHNGVATDLATHWQHWSGPVPDGFTAFIATNTTELHVLVREMWRLARSLPIEPLRAFEAETRNLPRTTEAERVVVQRVGQSIFRDALMEYWGGACAVLGVAEPRLLRASHIKPWAECETDAERLDVYNGLLLAAHLDAAFDAFLISFDDDGRIIFSDTLTESDRIALGLSSDLRLAKVAPSHLPRLAWHRERFQCTKS
ncbi:MAG: HNH endonuclease [Hyphomicrobiaceae bacterium]|nr:HNH endonuclease [Hyphomicrobiaceae bacterium]